MQNLNNVLTPFGDSPTDFVLNKEVIYCSIQVGGEVLYITRTNNGVIVDIFPVCGKEIDDIAVWVSENFGKNFYNEKTGDRYKWLLRYKESLPKPEIKAEDVESATEQPVVYITGYYKDDRSEFSGYKCQIGIDLGNDDDVFYYFGENESILGEHSDFIVTSYIDNEGNEHREDSVHFQKLTVGNVSVSFVDCGEGADGDFNPENPDDIPLLRLDIAIAEEGLVDATHYSHCTGVSKYATCMQKQRFLELAMNYVLSAKFHGESIKILSEKMSWFDETWCGIVDGFVTPVGQLNLINNWSWLSLVRQTKNQWLISKC